MHSSGYSHEPHVEPYKTYQKFQWRWWHQGGLAEGPLHLPSQHPHAQLQCLQGGQGPPGCCWGWAPTVPPSPASEQPCGTSSPATASGFAHLLPCKAKSSNHVSRRPFAACKITTSGTTGTRRRRSARAKHTTTCSAEKQKHRRCLALPLATISISPLQARLGKQLYKGKVMIETHHDHSDWH